MHYREYVIPLNLRQECIHLFANYKTKKEADELCDADERNTTSSSRTETSPKALNPDANPEVVLTDL